MFALVVGKQLRHVKDGLRPHRLPLILACFFPGLVKCRAHLNLLVNASWEDQLTRAVVLDRRGYLQGFPPSKITDVGRQMKIAFRMPDAPRMYRAYPTTLPTPRAAIVAALLLASMIKLQVGASAMLRIVPQDGLDVAGIRKTEGGLYGARLA